MDFDFWSADIFIFSEYLGLDFVTKWTAYRFQNWSTMLLFNFANPLAKRVYNRIWKPLTLLIR
jgi:hypothetical protein